MDAGSRFSRFCPDRPRCNAVRPVRGEGRGEPADPYRREGEAAMTKILVLYYSTYGHVETMAGAVADGARSVPGAEIVVKRVPELMPPEIAAKSGVKLDQAAPIAEPAELADYDAILFGTPTRFGNMAAQMRNFLDQTGGLWMSGRLIGKIGNGFGSNAPGGRHA